MDKLGKYHELNPGRRYEVVWEWEIDGHQVAYGYHEVDWDNGHTNKHPAVFCECDITCSIIAGHVNVMWSGDCAPKNKVYGLGLEGAHERYLDIWIAMGIEDAVIDVMAKAANLEWLGQRDRHINPMEMAELLKGVPGIPQDDNEAISFIAEVYKILAAEGKIKTIENYWYFVDPTIDQE
jgi:hypothetical protein